MPTTRQTGMPTMPMTSLAEPREDPIALLRKLVGASPVNAADPEGDFVGDPTSSLSLDTLRGNRQSELETRVANDAFGDAKHPDPNTGRDTLLLKFLTGQRAADPYTGQDATDRTHRVETNLDEASLYDRPEITKMRREELGNKERLATAPGRVAGEYGLRNRALQNEGEIEKQRIASQGVVDAARSKGGTGGGGHLAAGTLERVAGASNVVAGLNRLRELKPRVSIGPAAGRTQSLLQAVPLVPADEDFAAFASESSNIENNLLHTLSGAAVTPTEQERLRKQIPLPTDKDVVWEQKANALERSMRGLNKRIELLAAGVPAAELDLIPMEQLADDGPHTPGHAPAPTDDVVGITRGSASTGDAFGNLMQRADRAARPRR